jgi:hypothetical protein
VNKWECDDPECDTVAIGEGGAIGLTAIGWQFEPGGENRSMLLFCPKHRRDPIPCTDTTRSVGAALVRGQPCSHCRADQVATAIQYALQHHDDQILAWDAERRLAGKQT